MIRFVSSAVLLASLLVCCPALAAEPSASTKPSTAPTTSPWGVKQVLVGDRSLPHVLLIGDSILNGYNSQAADLLRGKVNLDAWITPKHVGGIGGDLKGVLAAREYDVIFFNDIGLHAWQPGRIAEGKYETLLRAHLANLHTLAPKAKLIFATTTPILTKAKPFAVDPEKNPIITERNVVAAKVMKDDHVPIADFYAELVATPELSSGDGFHWTKPAYAKIARLAAERIAEVLKLSLPATQPVPAAK